MDKNRPHARRGHRDDANNTITVLQANERPATFPDCFSSSCGEAVRRLRVRPFSSEEENGKEVIQPHVPVRLPCYDFTPITNHNFIADKRLFRLQWAFVV